MMSNFNMTTSSNTNSAASANSANSAATNTTNTTNTMQWDPHTGQYIQQPYDSTQQQQQQSYHNSHHHQGQKKKGGIFKGFVNSVLEKKEQMFPGVAKRQF